MNGSSPTWGPLTFCNYRFFFLLFMILKKKKKILLITSFKNILMIRQLTSLYHQIASTVNNLRIVALKIITK